MLVSENVFNNVQAFFQKYFESVCVLDSASETDSVREVMSYRKLDGELKLIRSM